MTACGRDQPLMTMHLGRVCHRTTACTTMRRERRACEAGVMPQALSRLDMPYLV